SAAAIATAAHNTLVGLHPALGLTPAQQVILDGDYAAYLAAIPDGAAKTNGIAVGEQVAAAVVALRMNDGRELNPTLADLNPPPPGPGIWERNPGNPLPPVLGLRLPGIRPLALESASQFRPDGPNPLTSEEYAEDFNQVKDLGRLDSATRTPAQTAQALFWTDHDLRQWNDGMLNLAVGRGLDLVQTARMLAMAHVSGGDADPQLRELPRRGQGRESGADPGRLPLSQLLRGRFAPRAGRRSLRQRALLPAGPLASETNNKKQITSTTIRNKKI